MLMPFTASKSLLKLLLLGAIVMLLGFLIITLVMSGQVMNIDPDILSRIEQGDIEALQFIDPQVIENAIFAIAVGATISGTVTYFAVPLIWFRDQQIGRSIILGLSALARNWRPLLVVGLMLGLMAVPIALLFGSFYLSALTDGSGSSVLAFLILLLGPLFQLLLFGTQYLAFRDIFGLDATSDAGSKPSTDQLVA
jgi:hypothetical protein